MKNPKAQTEVALRIGPAALEHLPAITQIYNQAILKTTATFDTTPKTLQEQEIWFAHHGPKYPVLVCRAEWVRGGVGFLKQMVG
jgi:L-amino acid N-acyltransferase YncA